MILRQKLVLALAFVLPAAAANANPVVYILSDSQQFGTVDLSTGSFSSHRHRLSRLAAETGSGTRQDAADARI